LHQDTIALRAPIPHNRINLDPYPINPLYTIPSRATARWRCANPLSATARRGFTADASRFSKAILDFSKETDVALLDQVSAAFYQGSGVEVCSSSLFWAPATKAAHTYTPDLLPQQQMAQQLLTQFQDHPDAWQRVPAIIEQSNSPQNKVSSAFFLHRISRS